MHPIFLKTRCTSLQACLTDGYDPRLRGFTLTELLVVIAVIGVLTAMLIPSVGLVQSQALTTNCQSNQRQMMSGILAYIGENEGFVPANDSVAGCDWTLTSPSPLFDYVGGTANPPIPSYMTSLQSSQGSSLPVDAMARLSVDQCPAVRRIFQTQDFNQFSAGNSAKNIRPNYVSSRIGPPNIALAGGDLALAMDNAAYSNISKVARTAECGFVFCGTFRLDRLGVSLTSGANVNPTTVFPVHAPRKEPNYTTTAYGGSFDCTDPKMYQGRVNVGYLDGHVKSLGYITMPGSLGSAGGGDSDLPASTPSTPGSAVSHFLRGGN